jgi:hypothetical protein
MDYTPAFITAAERYPAFLAARAIIEEKARGNTWLIGGFVCRAIIEELYGIPLFKATDFDFIVEIPQNLDLPADWKVEMNRYGNPKLVHKDYTIDYIPLQNIHYIRENKLKPTIENFLKGVPLTTQAIGFDIKEQKIFGNPGIRAIRDKTVGINNLETAKRRAAEKGKSLEQWIAGVAAEFSFTPIL